ncbi:uncharacterized protein LOC131281975 [Anopheles ziemanni]|uniref:uncharacterized protein LOC131281975 n=1 Tax=Anopheles ziemanni TaxID=345580 RepID=UPI00265A7F4D|nr:uncharacterized protein LOC131263320 isoform X2 [Anopheles coustani]XP_058167338.1 uncharacterized protein LOC131281975 [Anopheles ziemanni]
MGLFPDPPITPRLKKRLFGGGSPRKSAAAAGGEAGGGGDASASARGSGGADGGSVAGSSGGKGRGGKNEERGGASGTLSKSSTPQQLSTSWEFIRSVSADNQYEAERDGLNEIIATPRYLEFLKNYREEAAAIAGTPESPTLAVGSASPRYIEVRKGRIVLESSTSSSAQQPQQPPLPSRNGVQAPPDCDKTDYHHHQHKHQHQQHQQQNGRDSVLRITRDKLLQQVAAGGYPVPPSVDTNTVPSEFPPLPPSPPPPPPPAHQGQGDSQPSPQHECGNLVRNTSGSMSDSCKNTEMLEARIAELEEALFKLQERVNQSQCNSPTLEKEIKEHLEVMTKAMKTKDRKSMQVCREHKTLQVRFQKQENSLLTLQNENKSLHQRVRQYETCLDDIMRKVVDALVAEDSLRDEVAILKGRVRDLEAQNAALVTHASPAKSRDEGYCTMSSGQPQPPAEGHLEELPEEPEQWLMSAEPCTADMEDWSMSQEELATALDEENHEWIWNSSFLTTAETQTEDITALLHDQIVYSEDEEVACTNFTRDFYRLVSFTSGSTRSLQSPSAAGGPYGDAACIDSGTAGDSKDTSTSTLEAGTEGKVADSSDEDDDNNGRRSQSPTPSDGNWAQVHSCSSSESSDALTEKLQLPPLAVNTTIDEVDSSEEVVIRCHPSSPVKRGAQSLPQSPIRRPLVGKPAGVVANDDSEGIRRSHGGRMTPLPMSHTADLLQDVLITCHSQLNGKGHATKLPSIAQSPASATWRRSTGWRRVQRGNGAHETHIPVPIGAKDRLKSPPPVPIRRTYAS